MPILSQPVAPAPPVPVSAMSPSTVEIALAILIPRLLSVPVAPPTPVSVILPALPPVPLEAMLAELAKLMP